MYPYTCDDWWNYWPLSHNVLDIIINNRTWKHNRCLRVGVNDVGTSNWLVILKCEGSGDERTEQLSHIWTTGPGGVTGKSSYRSVSSLTGTVSSRWSGSPVPVPFGEVLHRLDPTGSPVWTGYPGRNEIPGSHCWFSVLVSLTIVYCRIKELSTEQFWNSDTSTMDTCPPHRSVTPVPWFQTYRQNDQRFWNLLFQLVTLFFPILRGALFQRAPPGEFFSPPDQYRCHRRCLWHPHFTSHVQLNVCSLGWVIESNTLRSVTSVLLSFAEPGNRWERPSHRYRL